MIILSSEQVGSVINGLRQTQLRLEGRMGNCGVYDLAQAYKAMAELAEIVQMVIDRVQLLESPNPGERRGG